MKSLKKYACIAVVAVLMTTGITGCGWWNNASEQTKENTEFSATQDAGNADGDNKSDVAANTDTQKPSLETSDDHGVISAPEVLIDQDAAVQNNNVTDNFTGNQSSDKQQMTTAYRQDHNGNGNQNNNGSVNQKNSSNKDSDNQENNSGNSGANDQGNNGGNTGYGDQGNGGGNTGSGDQGDNGGKKGAGDSGENNQPGADGSHGVELPEIPIN